MRKYILFLCFFILQVNCALSQRNFEIGQKWIYGVNEHNFPYQDIDSVHITSDTLINGTTYLKLVASEAQPCSIFRGRQYIREEDDKVYKLSLDFSQELLIANITSQDSFNIQFESFNDNTDSIYSTTAHVDSFGYETIYDGTSVRVQYLTIPENKSFEGNVIYTFYENIGYHNPGFIFADLGTGLCDPFVFFDLRCMIKGLDTLHFTKYDCHFVGIETGIDEYSTLDIHPNPTNDIILIPENYAFQKIVNLQGETYKVGQTNQTIDLQVLREGIYFVLLKKINSPTLHIAKVVKW